MTGKVVRPQTVSRLRRDLDEAVRQLHQAPLPGEWVYLFIDGQSAGVAAGRATASAAAGGLRNDLSRRGLKGEKLLLIVADGCPGLAAAMATVYPACRIRRFV